MLSYLIRRLLVFIFTLVIISLIGFIISIHAPADPLQRILGEDEMPDEQQISGQQKENHARQEYLRKLGLDKPVFYFGIRTLADIDTLYKIPNRHHRQNLKRISRESGNPALTILWFRQLLKTREKALKFKPDSSLLLMQEYQVSLTRIRFLLNSLLVLQEPTIRKARTDSLNRILSTVPGFDPILASWLDTQQAAKELGENSSKINRWIPIPEWFGINNQYHLWVFGDGLSRKGIIRGDFGLSYRDGQDIGSKISGKMKWSLTISLFALLIAYLVSIPTGIVAGYFQGGVFDRLSGTLLFVLYSIPSFFVGTLLLVLFANPDILDWFPSGGIRDTSLFNPEWPLMKRLGHYLPYLILPVITYAYGSLAFISRLVRSGIITQMSKDYIRTARAKGLSENQVVWKHAFRNTLLPLVTLFSSSLPIAFSGSVIIETIFNIPGMGLEIYQSVTTYDYPMIIAVFTIFGFLTITGYLLADLGYAAADPRIRFSKK
jgi:peptide/nickel transport system permease protein